MPEEKQKPLTRKDVENKVKERGGPQGLDLSERVFEQAIDLSGLDLQGIILKGARFPARFDGNQSVGAKFSGTDLTSADLRNIDFQYAQFRKQNNQPSRLMGADLRGSSLFYANFQDADLSGAKFGEVEKEESVPAMADSTDLRRARLFRTNFKGCYLYGTKLEGAFIRGSDIFDAHLEEINWGNYKIGEEVSGDFYDATHYYRRLKVWYDQSGYDGIAAIFYYPRERSSEEIP